MVSAVVSRLMLLTAGTLYPAYRSYKAVKTKNVREYVKWMMYWIVFAFFLAVETFADIFVSFWMPFYYEMKILFLIWLLSPYTKGASVVYRKFIHPILDKHEDDIDLYLEGAKNRGYTALVNFGSRGVNYAKEVVATAAVKGQMQLLTQITKSYSLNDVTEVADAPDFNVNRSQSLVEKINTASTSAQEPGDEMVDREFRYLDDELDNEPLSIRVKKAKPAVGSRDDGGLKARPKRTKTTDVDAYATLPRRSNRNVSKPKERQN